MQKLLKEIEEYILNIFPQLGLNKNRELVRLAFEISKKTKQKVHEILPKEKAKNFEQTKKYLLSLRYKNPGDLANIYLPKLDLNFTPQANLEEKIFNPQNIFIEDLSLNSTLAQRVKAKFPNTKITIFKGKFPILKESYSERKKNLIIYTEKFDFLKPCPCTKGANCCGYNLINLGFGCLYECNYCFLQQYQNLPAIALPSNIADFLAKVPTAAFRRGRFDYIRLGSGEFTDSLLFDDITNYSADIINFFKDRPELFEFKTKSVNIGNLLKMPPQKNIVVGWSVNPQNIIDAAEPLTPPLKKRLNAAAQIAKHGYKVAFHFDPVIIHENWQENYKNVVSQIAENVPKESIVWISIGTLRFSRELKKFIECRFPNNTILDEDFYLSFDGKMRYSEKARKEVYNFLKPLLKKTFPQTVVYLCMEK